MKLRPTTLILASLGALLAVVLYGVMQYHPFVEKDEEIRMEVSSDNFGEIPADWATDFNDDRKFVGFFQNVFVGRVLGEVEKVSRHNMPYSHYEVEIIYNIKGSIVDRALVALNTIHGHNLASGSTYLFGVIHLEKSDPLYRIGLPHPANLIILSQDPDLSNAELLHFIKRHSRVLELLHAYPNEVLDDVHIQRGITYNTFNDLTPEEQQAVYDKIAELEAIQGAR